MRKHWVIAAAVAANLAVHAAVFITWVIRTRSPGEALSTAIAHSCDELPVPYGPLGSVLNLPAFLMSAFVVDVFRSASDLTRVAIAQTVYLSISSVQIALIALGVQALVHDGAGKVAR